MLLRELVETSRKVGETPARNEKIAWLAELLRALSPLEIDIAVAYLSGELRQRRIGLGWAALREVQSVPPAEDATLTLSDVDASFDRLAGTSGAGSTAIRREELIQLFRQATPEERDFLARLIMGELRQGALAGLMSEALARAAGLASADVRRALLFAGDLREVARAALSDGRAGMERFSLQLFRPVQPMLAQSADTLEAALANIQEPALDWKLDGARVQVHKNAGEVRVFSRLLRDVSASVPELTAAVGALPVRRLVLDGEVIALREDGSPRPFQTTMQRFGRKLEVERLRGEIPLSSFFFDLLHLDGEDLLDRPARERFAALADALPPSLLVPRLLTPDRPHAERFLEEALRHGHEGVMVKDLGSTYEAGRRGRAWIKVKEAVTLDLVVLAAEWGHGRRQGFLSNLHLGALDRATGGFVMLGKTFKGLTDQLLAWQTKELLRLEVSRDAWTVYVRPELVVEVAFNDVQASPKYPGGMALRFARVKRYRPDKSAAQADTIETVRAIQPAVTSASSSRTSPSVRPELRGTRKP